MIKSEYEQLRRTVIDLLKDELKAMTGVNYIQKDLFNEAAPTLVVQMMYSKRFNRLYFSIDIDKYLRYNTDPKKTYIRLSSRILNSLYTLYQVRPEFIGPGEPAIGKRAGIEVKLNTKLTINTQSCWVSHSGNKYFLEDGIHGYMGRIFGTGEDSESKLKDLVSQIKEVNDNHDYITNKGEQVPEAFEEFRQIFRKSYKYYIVPFNEDDIFTYFLEGQYQ